MRQPRMVVALAVWVLGEVIFEGQSQRQARQIESRRYPRVYADSDGVSHFANAEMGLATVELGEGMPSPLASGRLEVGYLQFFCCAEGTQVDWHPAPRRQFYFILSGQLQLEVADGGLRTFRPGGVLLGEATHGRGVRARWTGAEPCVAVLPFPQE